MVPPRQEGTRDGPLGNGGVESRLFFSCSACLRSVGLARITGVPPLLTGRDARPLQRGRISSHIGEINHKVVVGNCSAVGD